MIRRFVLGCVVACAVAVLGAPAVPAFVSWCQDDPAVTVTTPAGNTVTVHVTLQARDNSDSNAALLSQAQLSGYATAGESQTTVVHVVVTLPKGGTSNVQLSADYQGGANQQQVSAKSNWGKTTEILISVPVP